MEKIEYNIIESKTNKSTDLNFLNEMGSAGWIYIETQKVTKSDYDMIDGEYCGEILIGFKHIFYRKIIVK